MKTMHAGQRPTHSCSSERLLSKQPNSQQLQILHSSSSTGAPEQRRREQLQQQQQQPPLNSNGAHHLPAAGRPHPPPKGAN